MQKQESTRTLTLYDKLGGVKAVKSVVDGFYNRILNDPKLSYFFDDVKFATLKLHQIEFMKIAFTKIPDDLDVIALMKDTHMRLFLDKGLNETHFDLVAGHFVAACEDLDVPKILIDEAVGVIGPLRIVFEDGGKLASEEEKSSSPSPTTVDDTNNKKAEDDDDKETIVDNNEETKEGEEKTEDQQVDHKTLLDKIGGVKALKAAVNEFYKRILDDKKLDIFFEDQNMTQIKLHQLKFMELAFTSIPDDVDVVQKMTDTHYTLFNSEKGLNETHFDLVAGHFVSTLEHLKIPKELIDEAVAVVVPLRPVFEQGAIDAAKRKQ